jgi:hypothetical protein
MSSKLAKSLARQQARAEQLQHWSETHRVDLEGLDEGQKWVVFLVLQLLALIGTIPPLRRVLGYFLAHCGMDLGSTLIGTLIGVSDRAVRATRSQSAPTFWEHLSQPARCPPPPPPKLGPEHAGPVAKYLVEHPRAKAPQILQFLAEELGVTMDRLTLRRYLARYGLGCLREETHTNAPLFAARPPMGVPSS